MSEATAHPILLVEDNPADIYLLERAIADCSPRICLWSVQDSHAALAFLRHALPFESAPSPALILLDLNLPERDGCDILAELRGMPAYQVTPVVILTGSNREADKQRCFQLGANAYVQKSVDFDTYFGRIQTIMRDWLGAECSPR
jgi:CheY-like chemotaxis protein